MDSNSYFTLEIIGVSLSQEEILTLELFENGAAGVSENLMFTQQDREYKPVIVEQDVKSLLAYFEQKPSADFLQGVIERYPDIQINLEKLPIKDWLNEWKKQWKAFELVDGIWVVPEWHRQDFEGRAVDKIYIDPGMAFGTGTHETTQIASQLLQKAFHQFEIKSTADIGTGSGILSFVSKLNQIPMIYCYDNDSESQRVFNENKLKNNMNDLIWVEKWQSELVGKVDLLIANIIDGVLLNLKPSFKKLGCPYILFTGILQERESAFLAEMLDDWNLQQVQRVQKKEWVGFLFREAR